MEISVRCVGRSNRVFSFDPKPGREEAVSDLIDHYISQMLTMVIHEVDASHDQKFQIYQYITTSYRRELMRHDGNANFPAEGMDGSVLDQPSDIWLRSPTESSEQRTLIGGLRTCRCK
eukprot:TRINITY_DN4311_c0_g1_i1.p1 TRINITY_DN4311_c0_g1~~TRINITY_DN4311_c0_g1_i1.p1  ORF type:complete len:118 (-),score=5.65 TRINITY_DN4311_c0_g1_i1:61-414(-)